MAATKTFTINKASLTSLTNKTILITIKQHRRTRPLDTPSDCSNPRPGLLSPLPPPDMRHHNLESPTRGLPSSSR
jgi:hypothetical protein